MVDVARQSGAAPVSGGSRPAGARPTNETGPKSEPVNTDFNAFDGVCQDPRPKKMGRPRTRSSKPIHVTPGRAGYRKGCGCPECLEGHRRYHEAYNSRKRVESANESESAA